MKTTYITHENINMFEPVLPQSLIQRTTLLIGVMDDKETACGVLAAEEAQDQEGEKIINLLYLFVHPDYRRQKAASMMMGCLQRYASVHEVQAIQTQYPRRREYDGLFRFLAATGFEEPADTPDMITYEIPLRTLQERLCSKYVDKPKSLLSLSDCSNAQWNILKRFTGKMRQRGEESTIRLMPRDSYIGDASCVVFNDDTPIAFVLTRKTDDDTIEIAHVYMAKNDTHAMGVLLKEVCRRILTLFSRNVVIRMTPEWSVEELMVGGVFTKLGKKTELIYQIFVC